MSFGRGFGVCKSLAQEMSGAKKDPQNQKNRKNSTKEFSEQFEGVIGHYPVKQGV